MSIRAEWGGSGDGAVVRGDDASILAVGRVRNSRTQHSQSGTMTDSGCRIVCEVNQAGLTVGSFRGGCWICEVIWLDRIGMSNFIENAQRPRISIR